MEGSVQGGLCEQAEREARRGVCFWVGASEDKGAEVKAGRGWQGLNRHPKIFGQEVPGP